MKRIGLTGSIGAGKSTVSSILKELGAVIIDADAISRALTRDDAETLREIRSTFGAELFSADGKLNREKMAESVFSNDLERAKLEAILHPRIILEINKQEECLSNEKCVVFDIPLLFETGLNERMDTVWVVDAEEERRIGRLAERSGMSRKQAQNRIHAQCSDEEKRKHADVIIENNGSLAELRERVERLWQEVNER